MTNPVDEGFLRQYEFAIALHRASQLLKYELDAGLSNYAVNFLQLSMLLIVASGRAQSPATIARRLGVDPAVVTRALDRLEERQFVQRTRSLEDRRTVLVSLTEPGLITLAKLSDVASEILHSRLGRIRVGELEQLNSALTIVVG